MSRDYQIELGVRVAQSGSRKPFDCVMRSMLRILHNKNSQGKR